ncbi:AAA family ATPase [Pseudochrobactrum lubricantis]|uniref:AAA family ATPase n=1 Tax=Pseudochrobactrum lubricantis TaxID=558172 RepID=UPI0035DA463A
MKIDNLTFASKSSGNSAVQSASTPSKEAPHSLLRRVSKKSGLALDTTKDNRISKATSISLNNELIEFIEPKRSARDLVLSNENTFLLTNLVDEFQRSQELRRHGLNPRSKILFCGPPGCGKTLCAEVIAAELKLPLLVARLDGIITTYLGETASNLRKVFDTASQIPCVLFLDEFDALARTRTETSEHNEIRRVVNSLLTMIEKFNSKSLIIAATNLEASIDRAAWRRFDEAILFDRPDLPQIRRTLRMKTRNFPKEFDPARHASKMEGMSFSEIERICYSAIKQSILKRSKSLIESEFDKAIIDEQRRLSIRENIRNIS